MPASIEQLNHVHLMLKQIGCHSGFVYQFCEFRSCESTSETQITPRVLASKLSSLQD